ncbi:MAG: poly-beta-1,6-N-acetyl-D-glucosamine N-deacetylase PgaB [Candidatus Omnitrophica bacterium]|nr:poly-beta-1,6-N-acetyl-D-glucosamine N-deacetylase PgaB [Candidatus Omnitrophota bacterium]
MGHNFKILPVIILGMVLTWCLPDVSTAGDKPKNDLIVLCYHDIPKDVNLDNYAVDEGTFIQTIEYFRMHNFHFVSLDDLIQAQTGIKALPSKPVLLTFDDGYATFYDFVFPLLKEYKIPSLLAVVSGWLDKKPLVVRQKLMTWDQLKEVAHSGLVEIASHTHSLHQVIVYNPQGNADAAATAHSFDITTHAYEEDKIYQERVFDDILRSKNELEEKLNIKVRSIAWPYGKYNALTQEAAKQAGIKLTFALNDRRVDVSHDSIIERFMLFKNPDIGSLLIFLGIKPGGPEHLRIMQLDLDMIFDKDPQQIERNLSAVLDRVKDMKVTTVFLQAFADPEGTGNVKSVYFPNQVLPMRMDLFSRVAHQLFARCQVEVYAWMPVSSIILPDLAKTQALRVKKYDHGKIVDSDESYQRLSPFSQEAWDKLYQLYADLASNAAIDGVLFQDDGYLTDFEDFHPDALKEYFKITGRGIKDPQQLTQQQAHQWMQRKTDQLIDLTEYLKKAVRYYRPEALFCRNLYSPVLLDPDSEEWFAQNYQKTLDSYDYAVVMVYPYLEEIHGDFKVWFKHLVDAARTHPHGIEKTIFKIQAFDWHKKVWLKPEMLNGWLRALVALGAHHVGYYPDDFVQDHPRASVIREMMSSEDYPYRH